MAFRSNGRDEYEVRNYREAILLAFPSEAGEADIDRINHVFAAQLALLEILVCFFILI